MKGVRPFWLLFGLAMASGLFYSWGIDDWRFSFVGDEWAFYDFAVDLAQRNLRVNPFDLHGVYGLYTVMASFPQALAVKLFGPSNTAWRMANTALAIPSVFLFYGFLRLLFEDRVIAFSGSLFLGFSQYLGNFFKIGYVNPLCSVLFLFVLWMVMRVVRDPARLSNYVWLGVGFALSFGIYIGPLFPFLVAPFFVASLWRSGRLRGRILGGLALTLLVFVAIASLGFLTTPGWSLGTWSVLAKTSAHPEFKGYGPMFLNVGRNFLLYFRSFDRTYNHFVEGAYVDRLTSALILLGVGCAALRFRNRSYALLGTSYLLAAVLLGLTNPYPYTPTTRGAFFIPFAAAFAAIGFRLLWERTRRWVAFGLLGAIVVANAYESQIGVFERVGYSQVAIMVRELMRVRDDPASGSAAFLLGQDRPLNERNLLLISQAYGLDRADLVLARRPGALCDMPGVREVFYFEESPSLEASIRGTPCAGRLHWVSIKGYE